ncbi:hypothetical protein ACWD5B_31925 [Streptomyces tanashiensis]|uniref:hypothetical protein n=1 Tax=Streptomyces tanashiensis TaxID=67367 RepID=UPI0036CAE755
MSEDGNSSNTGKISKHVAWWVGVLAGIAGIAALVLTITGGDDFTVEEWAREASAACDALEGEVTENNRVAVQLLAMVEPDGPGDRRDQLAADAWTKLAGSERKITGEMGKIQMPSSRQDTVQSLLEAMNDVSDEDYGLAADLRRLTFDSQSFEKFAKQRNEYVAEVLNHLKTLEVTHCLPGQ